MTEEQIKSYYNCLSEKVDPPILGEALIKGEWVKINFYQKRTDDCFRVMFTMIDGRRCANFIESKNDIKIY